MILRVVRVIKGLAGLAIRVLRNRNYATPRVPLHNTAVALSSRNVCIS